ncbi:hypothetical protein [Corynebacterium variabile]|uniref:hypothetical protein n=1 Tax=Corynebacterium variabile TaxID=1727 RepID=UPI003F8E543C
MTHHDSAAPPDRDFACFGLKLWVVELLTLNWEQVDLPEDADLRTVHELPVHDISELLVTTGTYDPGDPLPSITADAVADLDLLPALTTMIGLNEAVTSGTLEVSPEFLTALDTRGIEMIRDADY